MIDSVDESVMIMDSDDECDEGLVMTQSKCRHKLLERLEDSDLPVLFVYDLVISVYRTYLL